MSPAFLVDGVTEKRFVEINCKGAPVKITGLNGNSVSTDALAKRVASHIRLWKNRYYPIVVLVDRERRSESSAEFAEAIELAVRAQGIKDELIIGVADRMIENWMCADPNVWTGISVPECVDDCSGISLIKGFDDSYKKAANGPELLTKSRASEIKKRSPSFAAFADKLAKVKCRWLTK